MGADGDRVREIFLEAAALPEESRAAFVRERCGADSNLIDEVESLLRFHDHDTDFLAGSPLEDAGLEATPADAPQAVGALEPGTRVGGFTVSRLLGAGGMGVVYEATQESPRRPVALKLMRAGFVSRAMLRRFEQEAQALALLRHPGIAQVYEAGTDRRGASVIPYLAMELVDGDSLGAYIGRYQPSTRERLELFGRICDAVSHAHQRGVVHRDLKPPNIFVDGARQPKILDFGIARLTGDEHVTASLSTRTGQILGTLSYISPEQLSGDPALVDVRADVYALGVIFYEMLSGRLPHDLSKSSLHEASRILRETDPPALGTLNSTLRGDVETIARKAMEKEPAHRYQSAAELAEDVRRHLRHEPIHARPPATWYRVRKFTRRNRGVVMGVSAVFLALSAGLVSTLVQARHAREQALLAQEAAQIAQDQTREAERQKNVAQEEILRANNSIESVQQINKFFQQMFYSINPALAQGREITVREVLDEASLRLHASEAKRAPFVTITLHQTFGNVYMTLGRFKDAEEHLRLAVQAYKDLGVPDRRDALDTQRMLANALCEQSRYAEAAELVRDALRRAEPLYGHNDVVTAALRSDLAIVEESLGNYDEAERLYRDDLATTQEIHGVDSLEEIIGLGNLALFLMDRGKINPDKLPEAEELARRALELAEATLPPEHPQYQGQLANLSLVLMVRKQYDQAEPLIRRAIELSEKVQGAEHPDVLMHRANLGILLMQLDRMDEADAVLTPLLETCRSRSGENAIETRTTAEGLARLRLKQARPEEAEALAMSSFESARAAHGETHDQTREVAKLLAEIYAAQGDAEREREWKARGGVTP